MANKRDQSKQKRAKENRAQRAARDARAKAAAVPFDQRVAAKAPSRAAPTSGSSKRSGKAGRPGREPIERAPRPGTVPVDVETLQGSWFSKVNQVPGGREVLMTLLLTVIMTVMVAMTPLFVEDGAPKDAKPTLTVFDSLGAKAALLLAVPLVLVVIAAASALKPRRRTIWGACLLGLGLFVMAVSSLGMFYLFPTGFLAWAYWRASKVEGPAPSLFRRRGGSGADPEAPGEASDETSDGSPDDASPVVGDSSISS